VGKKRDGSPKDTRANIEATGEFVVNVVGESSGPRMVRTAEAFDAGVSEFDEVGLRPAPSAMVKPPRIEECLVSMECRHERTIQIGKSGVIFGEILCFHLADSIITEAGTADAARLRPLGRMGGKQYMPLRDLTEIDGAGAVTLAASESLRLWARFRDRTVAMARALEPEHLARKLGDETVGGLLMHLANTTSRLRLLAAGRVDDFVYTDYGPDWNSDRVVAELEADRDRFVQEMLTALPAESERLERVIRHEVWHQGQIAATLRDDFPDNQLWRA